MKDIKTFGDLENGQVVELSNGTRYFYLNDKLMNENGENWLKASEYRDITQNYILDELVTVSKIYETNGVVLDDIFKDYNLVLVWERKKSVAVGDPVKFINSYGLLLRSDYLLENGFPELLGRYAYGKKPDLNEQYKVVGKELDNVYVLEGSYGEIYLSQGSSLEVVRSGKEEQNGISK